MKTTAQTISTLHWHAYETWVFLGLLPKSVNDNKWQCRIKDVPFDFTLYSEEKDEQ